MNEIKYYVITNSGILDVRDVRDCHLEGLVGYASLLKIEDGGRVELDSIEVEDLKEQLYEFTW